jgi:hypothetical protein
MGPRVKEKGLRWKGERTGVGKKKKVMVERWKGEGTCGGKVKRDGVGKIGLN